jgi:membrane protease YdiL (CAAX protease family)
VTSDNGPDASNGDPADAAPPSRPGVNFFTIEGRPTPALFVIGWLASILGLAVVLAGVFGNSTVLLFLVGPGLLSLGLVAAAGNQALERRARGAEYAGPSPILVFAAVVAVSFLVLALVGLALRFLLGSAFGRVPDAAVQLIAGTLMGLVYVGLLRLTVVGTGALSWAEMGVRRFDRQAVRELVNGASLAVPVIAVTLVVAVVLVSIFKVEGTSPLPPTGTVSGLLLQLLVGAVIAPAAEEFLFRGFALTAWRRTLGAQRAILRASLLFALAHVINIEASSTGEAIGLIAVGAGTRLPVAFVLGWVFVRRGSIWAPIGLHATFNAVLLIIANLAPTDAVG